MEEGIGDGGALGSAVGWVGRAMARSEVGVWVVVVRLYGFNLGLASWKLRCERDMLTRWL